MELSREILSDITIYAKYARFIPELNRRETWDEIVTRNQVMHLKKFPALKNEIIQAYEYVRERKVLPSMRSAQFAGRPIEINPVRIYNCSYLPMDHQDSFSELMFLLLSGVGVGYSVQRHHVKKLPEIRKPRRSRRYLVGDSIEGWADAVKVLMAAYFEGKALPVYDFSDIRPKGAMLITSGGKAPGPDPLRECLVAIKNILDRKEDGARLTPLEVHDINCYIADAVLAGGIRRSAMIALFDVDEEEMLTCKSNFYLPPIDNEIVKEQDRVRFYVEYRGERHPISLSSDEYQVYTQTQTLPWYMVAPHRGRANNSATILRHKIDKEKFLELWDIVKNSRAGEPGFFFTNDKDWGLNPCAEISLRPYQFCNLTTINASDLTENDQDELNARAKAAAFIATLQASYTNFHYLRDIWKETTEKEALIGVSMTGIASGGVLKLDMKEAAEIVKKENERVAKLIGINKAARTTTVKPEGTSSLVLGSSSGIHAWHNDYYIRRIRLGKNESLYHYLKKNHPEIVKDEIFNPLAQAVVEIPQKAPEGAILRSESALDLLNRVSLVWNNWVKPGHRKGSNINNVSTTVSIKDDEWADVGKWMWEHRNEFTALSVLPYDGHTYLQAPFEDISKEEYESLMKILHKVSLDEVIETEDTTNLQNELACAGNACEVK